MPLKRARRLLVVRWKERLIQYKLLIRIPLRLWIWNQFDKNPRFTNAYKKLVSHWINAVIYQQTLNESKFQDELGSSAHEVLPTWTSGYGPNGNGQNSFGRKQAVSADKYVEYILARPDSWELTNKAFVTIVRDFDRKLSWRFWLASCLVVWGRLQVVPPRPTFDAVMFSIGQFRPGESLAGGYTKKMSLWDEFQKDLADSIFARKTPEKKPRIRV